MIWIYKAEEKIINSVNYDTFYCALRKEEKTLRDDEQHFKMFICLSSAVQRHP